MFWFPRSVCFLGRKNLPLVVPWVYVWCHWISQNINSQVTKQICFLEKRQPSQAPLAFSVQNSFTEMSSSNLRCFGSQVVRWLLSQRSSKWNGCSWKQKGKQPKCPNQNTSTVNVQFFFNAFNVVHVSTSNLDLGDASNGTEPRFL